MLMFPSVGFEDWMRIRVCCASYNSRSHCFPARCIDGRSICSELVAEFNSGHVISNTFHCCVLCICSCRISGFCALSEVTTTSLFMIPFICSRNDRPATLLIFQYVFKLTLAASSPRSHLFSVIRIQCLIIMLRFPSVGVGLEDWMTIRVCCACYNSR